MKYKIVILLGLCYIPFFMEKSYHKIMPVIGVFCLRLHRDPVKCDRI